MKHSLLTMLRDTHTPRHQFRHSTEKLSFLLAGEAGNYIHSNKIRVKTPLEETTGELLSDKIVIIPILRAGLAMLPAFLRFYPDATVGFLGMRRDEITKNPHLYYENLPMLSPEHSVIIIDPMIATGGSGALALQKILNHKVPEKNIIYVGIVAAPEGISKIKQIAPNLNLVVAHIDEKLNKDAFIVPGIGDFGDRYFGTES
jgi:uracil phosphoribosyltransferase